MLVFIYLFIQKLLVYSKVRDPYLALYLFGWICLEIKYLNEGYLRFFDELENSARKRWIIDVKDMVSFDYKQQYINYIEMQNYIPQLIIDYQKYQIVKLKSYIYIYERNYDRENCDDD